MSDQDDSGPAPKVFFVDPDPFLINDAFLDTCFRQAYEAYAFPLDLVHILVGAFDEVLLFFTLERLGSEAAGLAYLQALQADLGPRVRMGVLYNRSPEPDQARRLETAFLLGAGLTAGCIGLPLARRRGQELVLNVLAANQAAGRRKRIRMLCHPPFSAQFLLDEGPLEVPLVDLSISHFTVELGGLDPGWDLGTKVGKIQLKLGARLLLVKALVALKRFQAGKVIYVFLFHPESSSPGLEDHMQSKVNQIIRDYYTRRTEGLIGARADLVF